MLISLIVSGPASFLFPYFFVFSRSPCVAECPPIPADPFMFVRTVGLLIATSSHCSSFEPRIVGTASNSRNSDLFRSALISVSLRPLRCDSLQVNCGTHPAKLSRKAVSDSVVDPCSPRTSSARQCVVTFLVFEHATLAYLGLFRLEPQPPSGRRSPLLVQHFLLGRSFRPCRTNTLTTIGSESSFLKNVQFRPDFLRKDDLVCFQGAADGR